MTTQKNPEGEANGNSIYGSVYALAFGQVYTRDQLRAYLFSTGLYVDTGLRGTAGMRARMRGKRAADEVIDRWVKTGTLQERDGGFVRWSAGPIEHFTFDILDGKGAQTYECSRWDYPKMVAALKDQRAQHDPKEQRLRELERRLAEQERIKEGA